MQIDDLSVKKIDKILLNENYVPDNEISTTLYLSFLLGKPMLIEGPPGVGKTQLAKVIASAFDMDFFRIQCYEGITFEQIVGEWNYQKQLLHLEAAKNESDNEEKIFHEEFFIRRPLLNAFLNEKDSVLLIDEIDKADEEVESFLLQALGEKEITINDLGTFQLANDLIVILTLKGLYLMKLRTDVYFYIFHILQLNVKLKLLNQDFLKLRMKQFQK